MGGLTDAAHRHALLPLSIGSSASVEVSMTEKTEGRAAHCVEIGRPENRWRHPICGKRSWGKLPRGLPI